jgi:hypothetical protein
VCSLPAACVRVCSVFGRGHLVCPSQQSNQLPPIDQRHHDTVDTDEIQGKGRAKANFAVRPDSDKRQERIDATDEQVARLSVGNNYTYEIEPQGRAQREARNGVRLGTSSQDAADQTYI